MVGLPVESTVTFMNNSVPKAHAKAQRREGEKKRMPQPMPLVYGDGTIHVRFASFAPWREPLRTRAPSRIATATFAVPDLRQTIVKLEECRAND